VLASQTMLQGTAAPLEVEVPPPHRLVRGGEGLGDLPGGVGVACRR